MSCSSINNEGITEAWAQVDAFKKILSETGQLQRNRADQAKSWMWSEIAESLVADLKADERVKALIPEMESAVLRSNLPATAAAQRTIDLYKKSN
jgi:LAO/AO transport system kinase